MTTLKNVTYPTIYKDPEHVHCENQVVVKALKNGEVIAIFNEERYPFHHDSGQTVFVRSKDGGKTWDPATRKVVLPYTAVTGNWDCGICELADGTLLVDFTIAGYFKRGIKPEQPSWASMPMTKEFGDWTWAYRTMGWLGTYVMKSKDGGNTWTEPIPVNARPLKHAGCRLGAWQLPSGSILLGVYGRIKGYGEEGENESTRSALIRSDDGGDNWEYYSTLGYDPASIIDYEEPALLRLKDGRMVCFLRTHVNPSGDAKNLAMVVSEDDGFSWSAPKFTNIWGYPAELIPLLDGRYLMIYGYRRPPYGVRGIVSKDGLTWDVKDEFVVRLGGVPGKPDQVASGAVHSSEGFDPTSGMATHGIDWHNPGVYQHIGYPSVCQLADGAIIAAYHEWTEEREPIQYVLCTRFNLAD